MNLVDPEKWTLHLQTQQWLVISCSVDEGVKTEDMRQWWDQYFIIYSRSLVLYTWKVLPANMYMYGDISVEKQRKTHWQDWIHVT